MTLLLGSVDVAALVTDELALAAMRAGFEAEAKGQTLAPVRLDAPTPTGFLRVMPAVLERSMGLKVMTLVEELGTRYAVLLCSVETGELQAIIEADELTRVRTAATTALAAQAMVPAAPRHLSVVGTGFEARGHVAFLAGLWPLEEVAVYSRSPGNRELFAHEVGARLGIPVTPCSTVQEAQAGADTVLLATKSRQPVVDGAAFRPGAVVLSIGSTRPDLRELDRATLARATTLVVDAAEQVRHDSGDIIDALGTAALSPERILELAELCLSPEALPRDADGERDLLVFKSVGTALQDLALARCVYERALTHGRGRDIGDVAGLKSFTT